MAVTKRPLPELLAPAGDMARLRMALRFGADAVYVGGTAFGMRAGPKNFSLQELEAAAQLVHGAGKKLYLTLNTTPTNAEMDALPDYVRQLRTVSLDAVIVADIGVLATVKRLLPDVEIHMSTQVGVMNYETAAQLHEMGASRVVLARELSIDDMARIRSHVPDTLSLEAFVHGAMCMSVSGRCLLSQYLAGRDANRGQCAQPCRWGYYLMEEKRPGQYFPIFEDERGSYILNAKDLCLIEYADRLWQAGIDSFKIEGRAKSEYYTAVVTGAWRRAMDRLALDPGHYRCPPELLEELQKVSHRQYSTGFAFGTPEQGQFYETGGYVRTWDIAAVVERCADGMAEVTVRNKFCVGDTLEAVQPGEDTFPLTVTALFTMDGAPRDSAPHPMEQLRMPVTRPVKPGSILRIEKRER